jgi:protoporphyrinogen/coproporphyrinogen III oxidase
MVMTDANQRRVVVIGAGMAGLAAARHLKSAGAQVTVFEKNPYVGGRVHTELLDGIKIDTGAQFITNFYTHTQQLIRELGLQEDIVPITGGVSIARARKLYSILPASSLLCSRLISLRSKLAVLKVIGPMLRYWNDLDVYAFYKVHQLDTCSIAEYIRRELDDELLDYLFEPLLSGIFYWLPEHTSQALLFPMLKASLDIQLFTLRHGLSSIPKAMATDLAMHCNTEVTRVIPQESGGYAIQTCINGQYNPFFADGVVCATPATGVSTMFPHLNADQRAFFGAIHYSTTIATAIALDRRLPPDFYGILSPRRETKYLATINVASAKNPALVPGNRDVIELLPSGPASQMLLHDDDASIREKLCADVRHLGLSYDLSNTNLPYSVYRWYQALPEFDVGHPKRLKDFADGKVESGRLVFAGDYIGGPFVEGTIASGLKAAHRLLKAI